MTPPEDSGSIFGTLFKPWRAHHELDGLSDAECRELVERRWRRDPPRFWLIDTAATVAALLAIPGAVLVLQTQTTLTRDATWNPIAVYGLIAVVATASAGLAAFVVHRLLELLLIRRTLRHIVHGAACPRCKQSLIGLPIYDDAHRPEDQSRKRVRCPECGKIVRLLKYGYSPQDLASWDQRVLPKDFEVRRRDRGRVD